MIISYHTLICNNNNINNNHHNNNQVTFPEIEISPLGRILLELCASFDDALFFSPT